MSDRSIYFASVKTRLGVFQIATTERGVIKINFPNQRKSIWRGNKTSKEAAKIIGASKQFLKRFISGQGYQDNKIKIDWSIFKDFDRRVLMALKKVPPQTTISYSELAKRANVPHAARAVGNPLNPNPIPILIPCHRIVRKDKSLGGYAGGIRWKQALLKLEHNHH